MAKEKLPLCPLLKKPCIQHECAWFCHVTGQNPQTGSQIDMWDCAIKWTPVVMMDAAKNAKGVQAAVETMRNDVVDRQDSLNNAIASAAHAASGARLVNRPMKSIEESGKDGAC